MKNLLNANDDWLESLRRYLYPKLHGPLGRFGESIGINLYATGHVGKNQYVGYFEEDEEVIEEELAELSAQRNPVAALKELEGGRVSEGSWVFLHEDYPDIIEKGMQLHLTLFESRGLGYTGGREIYAHYEDDWQAAPLKHLRSKNFSSEKGVEKATEILDETSFLILK